MSKYITKIKSNYGFLYRGKGRMLIVINLVVAFLLITTQVLIAQEFTTLSLSQALNAAQTKSLKKAEANQDLEITRLNAKIFAADSAKWNYSFSTYS